MAFDLRDVLSRLGTGEYGQDVKRINALEDAPLVAQKIIDFQKQQRAAPFIKALQNYGAQYGAAKTDADRQSASNAANLARSEFIKSGGSPWDLPLNLWGSDPSKGFQTGAGSYAAPYSGDNLTLGQKMKRAPFTGMFEGKPTAEYGQYLSSPEAQSWYLPLIRQSMEADIKNALRSANQPYSTVRSSGGSSSTPKPTQTERQNSALADAYDAVDQAYNAGLTYDEIESNIKSQTSNLTRQGVDIQKVLDYAASKAPAAQEEPGWYSRLDQKLGGWLPFGSPR